MLAPRIVTLALALLAPNAETGPRERVEAIILNADGESGSIRTSPEFMAGYPSNYAFGSPCHPTRLASRVIDELFVAMREGLYVRIEARVVKHAETELHCVQTVSFFARAR